MGAASDELNRLVRYVSTGKVTDARGNAYDTLNAALSNAISRVFQLHTHVYEDINTSNATIFSTNESAIVGTVNLTGNVTLKGLRLYWDGWTSRESSETGSNPSDIPAKDFNVQGAGVTLVNCYIHDYRGFLVSTNSLNFQMRGCVFGRMGWTAPDRGHGHGIYAQPVNSNMRISKSVCIENYGWGLNIYKQSEALSGMLIEDSAAYGSGLHGVDYSDILYGGYLINGASSFLRNHCLGRGTSLEFWKDDSTLAAVDVVITDNRFRHGIGGIYLAASETGNLVNTLGDSVTLLENEDDPDRYLLIIRNEAQLADVAVDVSAYLENGERLLLINTQDYTEDRTLYTVANGQVLVDMQAAHHSISTPIGASETVPASCFPFFGVFELRKQ